MRRARFRHCSQTNHSRQPAGWVDCQPRSCAFSGNDTASPDPTMVFRQRLATLGSMAEVFKTNPSQTAKPGSGERNKRIKRLKGGDLICPHAETRQWRHPGALFSPNHRSPSRRLLTSFHGKPTSPSPILERSWRRAWMAFVPGNDGAKWRELLIGCYREPHRKYHTLQHLIDCLELFEATDRLALKPREVELALWFHDAVCEVQGHENEHLSARLAQQALSENNVKPELKAYLLLIMATRHGKHPTHQTRPIWSIWISRSWARMKHGFELRASDPRGIRLL